MQPGVDAADFAGVVVAQEVVQFVECVAVIGAVRPIGDGERLLGVEADQAKALGGHAQLAQRAVAQLQVQLLLWQTG